MSDIQEQVLTPPTSALVDISHRDLRDDEYWRAIPAYADLRADEFHEHRFQSRNSVTSLKKLREVLGSLVPEAFYRDVEQGLLRSPMSLRISPYLLSLMDWSEPAEDPLRIQFLPMGSRMRPDHPELALDSLHEQVDSPVPGLTHRYADRGAVSDARHLSGVLSLLHPLLCGRVGY